jgi:hypothetical protein
VLKDPLSVKIFLSSVARDLEEYREAAYKAVERLCGYHCDKMEDFGAQPDRRRFAASALPPVMSSSESLGSDTAAAHPTMTAHLPKLSTMPHARRARHASCS